MSRLDAHLAAVVAAAVAGWLALLTSAALFARLPAAGTRLGELGWPEDDWPNGARAVVHVLVQPSGTSAWIAVRSHHQQRDHLCRVELATGRASQCAVLGPSADRIAHHRAANGWWLAHGPRAHDTAADELRMVWVPDDGELVRREIRPGALGLTRWHMIHLSAQGDQPVAWLSAADEGSGRLVAVRVVPSGRPDDMLVERWAMPEEPRLQEIYAVRGDPPAFIARVLDGELVRVMDGRAVPLGRRCPTLQPCVRHTSTLGFRPGPGDLVELIGPDGDGRPADLWPEDSEYRSAAHLADGRIHTAWMRRSDGDSVHVLQSTETIQLTADRAGLNWVLIAEREDGERRAAVRDVSPTPLVAPIPVVEGRSGWLILGTDAGYRAYAAPLDHELRLREPRPLHHRLAAIVSERAEFDPISTGLYILGLVGGAGLVVVGLLWWLLRRRHGKSAGTSGRRVFLAACWIYVLLVGGLLASKGSYLFPLV